MSSMILQGRDSANYAFSISHITGEWQEQFWVDRTKEFDMEAAEQQFIDELRRDFPEVQFILEEDGTSDGMVKWTDYEETMRAFSRRHPGLTFCFHVEGIDTGEDSSMDYWQNGKVHVCQGEVKYPEFDPKRLQ